MHLDSNCTIFDTFGMFKANNQNLLHTRQDES